MRTILLTLAYDGSGYCGWQVQPNGTSVQAVVERAIAEYTGENIRVVAAGRTDAGVHALGQLVSFNTAGDIPPIGFRLGLQTKLPEDIVVQDAIEVPLGFSARYDCVRKTYCYVIQNSPLRTPWLAKYVGWHRAWLDDRAMQVAANELVGTHDFRSFETDWPNKATSVRTLFEINVWRTDTWEVWKAASDRGKLEDHQTPVPSPLNPEPSTFLCIDFTADGFLYNMVRAMVGTLIHVGRGNWTAEDVRRILHSQCRAEAGETAPAQGLYLMNCVYEINPDRIVERLAGKLPVDPSGE